MSETAPTLGILFIARCCNAPAPEVGRGSFTEAWTQLRVFSIDEIGCDVTDNSCLRTNSGHDAQTMARTTVGDHGSGMSRVLGVWVQLICCMLYLDPPLLYARPKVLAHLAAAPPE
jgi:hypothetical protein